MTSVAAPRAHKSGADRSAANESTARRFGRAALGRQPIGMIFGAPYLLFIAVLFAYPLGLAVYMSFHRYYFTAPGVNVPAQGRGSKYWVVSGTSPACALTAGVAALVRSKYPRLTAAQVRTAIIESSSHHPKDGYDDHVGFGTVDAGAALRTAGVLARQVPAGDTRVGKAAASGQFGNGQAGVSAFPVPPRGRGKLFVLLAIAAAGSEGSSPIPSRKASGSAVGR